MAASPDVEVLNDLTVVVLADDTPLVIESDPHIVIPDTFGAMVSEPGAVPVVGPQGPPGPAGPTGPAATGVTVEALVDLNAYTVVKVMGTGQARPASSLIIGDGEATTGVTTAAALAGEQVPIRTVGAINVAGTLPVGPLYLGTDGALTPNHDTGQFQLRIGYAQTPNLLIVRIDPPIYR